jgi:hypothetical protein
MRLRRSVTNDCDGDRMMDVEACFEDIEMGESAIALSVK